MEQNALGKTLRKLRGDRTLREIAEITGISHTYLGLLEKGIDPRTKKEIKPSAETLQLLAKTYQYPYDELLKLANYLPEETRAEIAIKFFLSHPEEIKKLNLESSLLDKLYPPGTTADLDVEHIKIMELARRLKNLPENDRKAFETLLDMAERKSHQNNEDAAAGE